MNMHSSIIAMVPAYDWEEALHDYQAKRATSEGMPGGADGEDDAVDAYCLAMDHLIENVPADTLEQLKTKIDLAIERADGFNGIFEGFAAAIVADLERLSHPLSAFAFGWLQRWTFMGGDVTFDVADPERAMVGWPAYDLSPVAADNDLLLRQPEANRAPMVNSRRSSDQYSWEGGIRQLLALLNAVPGGSDAIEAVLRVNPKLGHGRRAGE